MVRCVVLTTGSVRRVTFNLSVVFVTEEADEQCFGNLEMPPSS